MKLRSVFFLRHLFNTDNWIDSSMIDTNKGGKYMHHDSSFSNQKRYLSSTPDDPLSTSEFWQKRIQYFLAPKPTLPNCIDEETYEVELGIIYDNSYCEDNGNTMEKAEKAIEDLINAVNAKFETTSLCIEFIIMHLDGDCGSQDLLGDLVDIKDSTLRLKRFKQFWMENKNEEFNVDAAILITGDGTTMKGESGEDGDELLDNKPFLGRAYMGGVCKPIFKFAVAALDKECKQRKVPPEAVVTHQLGHLLGADHYEGEEDYIMQDDLGPFAGELGFSEDSLDAMESHLQSLVGDPDFDCVKIGTSSSKESVVIVVEKMASLGFASSFFLSIVVIGSYWVRKRRI